MKTSRSNAPTSYGAAENDRNASVARADDERAHDSSSPSSTYVENAKYALVIGVVWTYALGDFLARAVVVDAETLSVRKTKVEVLTPILPYIRAWYLTLGMFTMPLFAAIAGYQSKSWLDMARSYDAKAFLMLRKMRQSTSTLIGGWVLWQALYVLVVYPTVRPLQWWAPIGVTWFLLALYIWRSSVLLFGGMKDNYIYAIVLAVAILTGFTETPVTENGLRFLDWQRVCTYSLYFYAGLVAVKRAHVDAVLAKFSTKPWWLRVAVGWIALGLIFGAFLLVDYLGEPFSEVQEWVFAESPYGFSAWYHPFREAAMRIVLYWLVAAASMAFMLTLPVEKYWFTAYGSRTITAYLLHRVLLNVYDEVSRTFWDDDDISVAFQITMGVFVLPLVVSQLALSPPVLKLLAPLVDPAPRASKSAPWLFHESVSPAVARAHDDERAPA